MSYEFESDPESLRAILEHRNIGEQHVNEFDTTLVSSQNTSSSDNKVFLTPASKLSRGMKNIEDRYDFFEGKNGNIFYRPSASFRQPLLPSSADKKGSGQKSYQKRPRAMGTILLNNKPKRMPTATAPAIQSSIPSLTPRRGMHLGFQRTNVVKEKDRRSVMIMPGNDNGNLFKKPFELSTAMSEKKALPFIQPPHRQSISERKPLAPKNSNLPFLANTEAKMMPLEAHDNPGAKKSLNFGGLRTNCEADEDIAAGVQKIVSPVPPEPRSRAELILMREGLRDLPRESMSFLLRQSLSKAELDRLFDDDSTESFEALEKRMRTPNKKHRKRLLEGRGEEGDDDATRKKKIELEELRREQIELEAKMNDEEAMNSSNNSEEEHMETRKISSAVEAADDCPGSDFDPEVFFKLKPVMDDFEELFSESESKCYEAAPGVLKKSQSMVDLDSPMKMPDSLQEPGPEVIRPDLPRKESSSALDVRDNSGKEQLEVSRFIRDALAARARFIEEQEEIRKEMESLMNKAKARREEFRTNWGVSPMSINKKRTVKIFITPPLEVSLSNAPEDAEQEAPVNIEHEDELEKRLHEELQEELTNVIGSIRQMEENQDFDTSTEDNNDMLMTPIQEREIVLGKKSVRFNCATPQEHLVTPDVSSAFPIEEQVGRPAGITVNVPLHIRGKASNICLNESTMSDVKRTHVDTPRRHAPLTTPLAVRQITHKAQEELAMLYDTTNNLRLSDLEDEDKV